MKIEGKIKGLYKRKDSGVYYFQPPQVNKLRRGPISLGTKDFVEAVQRASAELQKATVSMGDERLEGEIIRFIEAKKESGEYTWETSKSTRLLLNLFCKYLGNPLISQINQSHIQGWKDFRVKQGCEEPTVATSLARVKGFFSWCVNTGRLSSSPCKGVKVPTVRKTRRNIFCTAEQRDHLIACCPKDREDLLFFLMAGFFLGLRNREILEAVPQWFETPGIVTLTKNPPYFTPKDKERRVINYGPRFAEFLKGYGLRAPYMLRPDDVRKNPDKPRYDMRKSFNYLREDAGLPWVTPHVMRHTYATLLLQKGVALHLVARLLGDNYDTTFNNYYGHSLSLEDLKHLD